jgi:hypothetical protein
LQDGETYFIVYESERTRLLHSLTWAHTQQLREVPPPLPTPLLSYLPSAELSSSVCFCKPFFVIFN